MTRPRQFSTTEHESVNTDGVTHGSDIVTNLNEVSISPSVSDIGAAIMSAIDTIAPGGGRIQLPAGTFTADTQISLDSSAYTGHANMPIILQGVGPTVPQSTESNAGTLIEPTANVAGPLIAADNAHFVSIRDLAIGNGPTGVDAIQMGLSGYCRSAIIDNVTVANGSAYGVNVGNFYGGGLNRVYARSTQSGIRLKDMNAANMTNIVARVTNTDGAAVRFEGGRGWNASMIYSESNQGAAIETAGYCREGVIDGVYLENNNTGGNAEAEIHLGNTGTLIGNTSFVRIAGVRGANMANPVTASRVLIEEADHLTLSQARFGSGDLTIGGDGSPRGYQNHYFQCSFTNVDTTTNSPPELWSGCSISGTASKSTNAQTLIGD